MFVGTSDTNEGVILLVEWNSFILDHMWTDRYQISQHSDYPTTPTLTKVLTAIFCYCS